MTTNMAEVLKLAARPTPYDHDESTWQEFRFKLGNCSGEREVRGASAGRRISTCGKCSSGNRWVLRVHPNIEPHTVRLVGDTDHRTKFERAQRVPNRSGFEVWRQLVAESAPKTAGRRFAMLQAVLQLGIGDTPDPAKFEEAWKAWEHQVDVCEKPATSKLDDDVKISVVLREAPTELRDNLLLNFQHFESNCNKLRAITQVYLNSNKKLDCE